MQFRQRSITTALATFATLGTGLAMLPPAQAAATAPAPVASPRNGVAGESVTFEGRLTTHAERPVRLQRRTGNSWVVVRRGTTGATGAFAFTSALPAGTAGFRVFAPRTDRYAAQSTAVRQIVPQVPRAYLSFLPAAIGQSKGGTANITPIATQFSPAREGRPVTLRRYSAGAWTTIGTARQDEGGRAAFLVSVPAGDTRRYQAVTASSRGAAAVGTTNRTVSAWRKVFADEFSGDTLDESKWSFRQLGLRYGRRLCAENSVDSVAVSGGELNLSVLQLPLAEREMAALECPSTEFENGMVGTQGKFDFTYGVIAAKARFPRGKGQHGGIWSQTTRRHAVLGDPAVSGAEIDIAEYFGDGSAGGGLSHLVHWRDKDAAGAEILRSVGGVRDSRDLLRDGRDWSDDFHVYSVEWTPTQYIFRVDGNETFRTNRGVSNTAQYVVLSLLTSDWELPQLQVSQLNPMSVDWVRVYQR